jgi:hypothetical protein
MRPARLRPIMQQVTKPIVQNHARILSGNISYGSGVNGDQQQNINGVYASGTTPGTPNTTFSVSHILGRVPIGFHTVRINMAGVIFDSGTPWTATTISLQCSVASAVFTLFIF